MRYTIFNTPVITPIIRILSKGILWVIGWRIVGEVPRDVKKYVAIVAPHTSNWDFLICFLSAFVLKLNAHWIGKHTLFPFPFRSIVMWCGGLPVNRQIKGDTVTKVAQLFEGTDTLAIGISPEGTRKAVTRWRTGYWYIAERANVPVIIAFIDYKEKVCGIHGVLNSAGNFVRDEELIKAFYSTCVPKYPENFRI